MSSYTFIYFFGDNKSNLTKLFAINLTSFFINKSKIHAFQHTRTEQLLKSTALGCFHQLCD